MKPKRFSNQTAKQILKHLRNFLQDEVRYNLNIDSLGVRFIITETIRGRKSKSRVKLKSEDMTKKQRRLSSTKKSTRPKIRSVKKGRVIKLRGKA